MSKIIKTLSKDKKIVEIAKELKNNYDLEENNDYDGLDIGSATVKETQIQNGYAPIYNPYNGTYEV